MRGDRMSRPDDLVATYRLHAANCVEIAHRVSDAEGKLALLGMAQAWLVLAQQVQKNSETMLVYETPVPRDMS